MVCPQCLRYFTPEHNNQVYCSRKCCKAAYYERECVIDDPPDVNALRYFHCEECGRGVNIYPGDKRYRFCSGKCYMAAKNRRKAERQKRQRGNLGISGGMCLGNLIRRERSSLD